MLSALIMAGGRGTRFWPLSTEKKPKQFLSLVSNRTMIQMTVDRITDLVPLENIFICTGTDYISIVKEQLPQIPVENIIVEPQPRNTAPCITLSTMIIDKSFPGTDILVLPSDQLITDNIAFQNTVSSAKIFLQDHKENIITIGIQPTRPDTGFGYIRTGGNLEMDLFNVESFVEKPDAVTAIKYLQSGQYLWNGGMFIWNSRTILRLLRQFSPQNYLSLSPILEMSDMAQIRQFLDSIYQKMDAISIDYAVLEKAKKIVVVKGEFGWDDVGSWNALERYRSKDSFGNIILGNVRNLSGKNNIIVTSNPTVYINGLEDIYVIENENQIFVGKKDNIKHLSGLRNILEE